MNLLGVVLCGGKSSRMGTDKGLIQKGNLSWAESAYVKLCLLSVPVVVSINNGQEDVYGKIFLKEIMVKDELSIGGPLNGILSVHRRYPDKDLMLLACDIVDLNPVFIQRIYDVYMKKKKDYDFFVYKRRENFEPLCGIYTSHALEKTLKDFQSGILTRFSMKNILETGNTFSIRVETDGEDQFVNYNEPGILSDAGKESS